MASKIDMSLIKQETEDEAEDTSSLEPQEAKRRKKEASGKLQTKNTTVKKEHDLYDKERDDESESQEENSFWEDLAKWTERVKHRVKKYEKAGGGRALAMAIMSKEGFDYHMKDDEGEALNMFTFEEFGNGRGLELSESRGFRCHGLDCRGQAHLLLDGISLGDDQHDFKDIEWTVNRSIYVIPGAVETWTNWSKADWDLVVKEAESLIGPFPGPFTVSRLAAVIEEMENIVFPQWTSYIIQNIMFRKDSEKDSFGLVFRTNNGQCLVQRVQPHCSVPEGRIQADDEVISINGRDVLGWNSQKVTSFIKEQNWDIFSMSFRRKNRNETAHTAEKKQ